MIGALPAILAVSFTVAHTLVGICARSTLIGGNISRVALTHWNVIFEKAFGVCAALLFLV